MKMVSGRTRDVKVHNKKQKKFFMYLIAAMVNTTDYKELRSRYVDATRVFGSEFMDSQVEELAKRLDEWAGQKQPDELWDSVQECPKDKVPEGVQDSDEQFTSSPYANTIREASEFGVDLKNLMSEVESDMPNDTFPPNPEFCKEFVEILKFLAAYVHIWTGITFQPLRYAIDRDPEKIYSFEK